MSQPNRPEASDAPSAWTVPAGASENVDFGKTADDYARWRPGFPEELFDRLAKNFGVGLPGQRILDLGTGTGALSRALARRGCRVSALDIAPEMVAKAREMAEAEGLEIAFRQAPAEETGLPDASFDIVAAGQCWHWFDRPRAAAEASRLLAEGGRLLIAHFDWLPLPGNLVEATEEIILRHRPDWPFSGGSGVYPAWLRDARAAGFREVETFTFDAAPLFSREAWRGRMRASAPVAASLPPEKVAAFDADLAAMLAERFPGGEPLAADHRVFALVARAPLSPE